MAPTESVPGRAEAFDFIIVGAGLSGINSAYRIQTQFPNASYVVLEDRDQIGGTWDLFRYPGARSDSEMWTLGFAWHSWPHDQPIADGPLILEYMRDAASKNHIDKHIRFRHKVLSADWLSGDHQWYLTAVDNNSGNQKRFEARWIVLGTGYFDYQRPIESKIPGLDKFKGKVINPQFWPGNYEYNDRIALIGSGATAVSLLPCIAKKAAHVTMIQRSPSYIAASPNTSWAHKYLPLFLVAAVRRIHYITMPWLFVVFCSYFPNTARQALRSDVVKLLPSKVPIDPHFTPRYDPWDQRICLDPDGAFYKALHRSNVDMITGTIKNVTESGIQIQDGTSFDVDTIVTATGLTMKFGGGIKLRVDGEDVTWAKKFVWNGSMLENVPNMTFTIGYTHNGWTLGADDAAMFLGRLWAHMQQNGIKTATPRIQNGEAANTQSIWPLNATYVRMAEGKLPVYGTSGPWKPKTRPPVDWLYARFGDYLKGLQFST